LLEKLKRFRLPVSTATAFTVTSVVSIAISDFRKAEWLEPADYRPHSELGSIYSADGQEREAGEEHEWEVRLSPEATERNVGAFGSLKRR
jgi:hypothetical protein